MSVNRAVCSNPAIFKGWFEQHKRELERLNITSPEQIWNCNETGCQDVCKEWDVVGETVVDAYTIVSKEQVETTTVLSFANAVGKICQERKIDGLHTTSVLFRTIHILPKSKYTRKAMVPTFP